MIKFKYENIKLEKECKLYDKIIKRPSQSHETIPLSNSFSLFRMGLVPCIAVSTGYILLVLFLAELARRLVAPLNAGLVKTALNVGILIP
jgi:hypothetical protein